MDVILQIALIVGSVFLCISIINYFVELRRYVNYLEKKIEDYRDKEIIEARKKEPV